MVEKHKFKHSPRSIKLGWGVRYVHTNDETKLYITQRVKKSFVIKLKLPDTPSLEVLNKLPIKINKSLGSTEGYIYKNKQGYYYLTATYNLTGTPSRGYGGLYELGNSLKRDITRFSNKY